MLVPEDLDAADLGVKRRHAQVEDDAQGAEAEEAGDGTGKKKSRRARRTASDLNLLSDPQDVIIELTESTLQELAGKSKLHQLRYPTFIVLTHPNFQLRMIDGLAAVKGTALKELDLSLNKLMVIDGLEQFSTLKARARRARARRRDRERA